MYNTQCLNGHVAEAGCPMNEECKNGCLAELELQSISD
jgi:hypothetical protein